MWILLLPMAAVQLMEEITCTELTQTGLVIMMTVCAASSAIDLGLSDLGRQRGMLGFHLALIAGLVLGCL